MTSRELLTVIVPCYNEERLVATTTEEILAARPELDVELQIILCDDGSTDGTAAQMEALCAQHDCCRMHRSATNIGAGRIVQQAFELVEPGSWVTVMPGDAEIVFASIKNLLAVRHDYDLVMGYVQNPVIRTFTRRMASAAYRYTTSALYGYSFRYLNGIKLYRVEVFKGIETVSGGHAINGELIAKATLRNPELRIGEAPFVWRGRSQGASKAFRPGSILRAVRETYAGFRAVARYRDEVIRGPGRDPAE